jgi:hypothetical protein
VNIKFMFNGDRLAFVKGYKRKQENRQPQLAYAGSPALAAPTMADGESDEPIR